MHKTKPNYISRYVSHIEDQDGKIAAIQAIQKCIADFRDLTTFACDMYEESVQMLIEFKGVNAPVIDVDYILANNVPYAMKYKSRQECDLYIQNMVRHDNN